MAELNCPVCASSDTGLRYPQFENPWHFCRNCGLRFRHPQLTLRYETGSCFSQAGFYYGEDFVAAYRRALREFLPHTKPGRFIEVGFGHGGYLAAARDLGFDVFGLDTSAHNVHQVASRFFLPVQQATLEEALLADASFDTALLSHVIEHLPDPAATLRELARVLTVGGKLILLTPNADCYLERLVGHRWPMYRPPDHIRMFTPTSLRMVLQESGFAEGRLWTADSPADSLLGLASALRPATRLPSTSDLLAQHGADTVPLWRRIAYRTLPLLGYPFLLSRYFGRASCLKCVATKR